MSFTEVIGNRALRASVYANYTVNAVANVQYLLFVGPGAVIVGGIPASWPGGNVGPFTATQTGLTQVYVNSGNGAVQFAPVTDTTQTYVFPAGTLPLAVVHTDAVGRIQLIEDQRPTDPL
jgi:hypothetical protein